MIHIEQIEKGIALIKMNRPQKRNALNAPLLQSLHAAIEKLQENRVLILCGEDPVFCSGMDLSEREDKGELIAKVYRGLLYSPLLTIAAVQGAALAGGLGLMAACDLAIAHPKTHFGIPELQRGLIPSQVLVLLRRQIPLRSLNELLYLGEMIDAAEAKRIGLINRLADQPLQAAIDCARQSLKGAPEATRQAKKLLHELDSSLSEQIKLGLSHHQQMVQSEEAKRGIEAFLKKEKLNW